MLGSQGGRMIGGMIGGRTGAMVGGFAGAMLGGRQIGRLGGLVKGRGGNEPDTHGDLPPMQEQEAEILIKAMCNAAKADGVMDQNETDQILGELGDVSEAEQMFLRNQIAAPPISAAEMARQVPPELAAEAYAVSLISINVDTVEEASYLQDFASALRLSENDRDNIHDDLGADLL